MKGKHPKQTKKIENYNRLQVVIDKIMEREDSAIYAKKLYKSFTPLKHEIKDIDEYWEWIERMRKSTFHTLSESEQAFAGELMGLMKYTDEIFGGQFDPNLYIVLGGVILFKKLPKKYRLLGISLQLTEPKEHNEWRSTAIITIQPNALQREVIAFIKRNWEEISSINKYTQLDEMGKITRKTDLIPLDKQRTKTVLKRDKRIMELYKNKEPYKEIQYQLNQEGFGLVSLDILRKVVSDMKKKKL